MSMTREEARIELQAMKDTFEEYEPGGSRCQMTLKVALSALRPVSREQVERMFPGCPYCKSDSEGYVQKFGAYSIQNGELTTGHCKPQKINFCPHCSRPLIDEAVDMMLEKWRVLYD